MARTKKEKWPQHKMGKRCGYDEFEDGSIQPASMYSDRINTALDTEAAVNALIRQVVAQCHELYRPAALSKDAFWESVKEDYGLDFDNYEYSYNRRKNRIYRRVKNEKVED